MNTKEIRCKLGLTKTELAKKLGVSWVTVNRWEKGLGKPSPLALKALEELLKEQAQ